MRFHSPLRSAAWAGLTWRAAASIRATASSAALTMLEVGALTTITPDWVAALTSTLSRPTPARATTLSRVAAASASASTLVAERTRIASTSAIAGEQLGAVGAVAVPDLEVGPERLDGGGAELFGDEYDGLAHSSGVLEVRGQGWAESDRIRHDAVPGRLYRRGSTVPRPSGWSGGVSASPTMGAVMGLHSPDGCASSSNYAPGATSPRPSGRRRTPAPTRRVVIRGLETRAQPLARSGLSRALLAFALLRCPRGLRSPRIEERLADVLPRLRPGGTAKIAELVNWRYSIIASLEPSCSAAG